MAGGNQYQVRALERALTILDAFTLARPERSLTEVAVHADIPKSTAFRLLSILEEYGYVDRDSEAERYRIGVRAFELGSIYIQTTTVQAQAEPYLHQLAESCHQTANLGILNRGEVVHIAVIAPDRPIRYFATVGDRAPVYCSGLGKALISEHDKTQLDELLRQHPPVRHTQHTITTPQELADHLEQIRQQGYSLDNEESFAGLKCVAAPIRDDKGEIVAAISVSGPAAEFSAGSLPRFIDEVKRAATGISERLGHAVIPVRHTQREAEAP